MKGDYTDEDGFEISTNIDRVASAVLSSGGTQTTGFRARPSLHLEAADLCLYDNDIDEQITPIEPDLIWTIGK